MNNKPVNNDTTPKISDEGVDCVDGVGNPTIIKRVDHPELGYYIQTESRPHGTYDVAYSLIDDGYIGDETWVKMLITDRGILPQRIYTDGDGVVCSIGKSTTDGKWYGWSHRSIYGFEIRSEVKWGDCAYMPANAEEFGQAYMEFFTDKEWNINQKYEVNVAWNDERVKYPDEERGPVGVYITADYTNDVPNKKLRGTQYTTWWPYPEKWGKGAWVAETEEDAKQMAIDFADSVS
ncbi:MAG: hypothetical protein COA84_13005 [Robiginitomaculum sp.]|nr:MAG: hypothetical protein COA84_13005 [Robiginitomaculum sp.]